MALSLTCLVMLAYSRPTEKVDEDIRGAIICGSVTVLAIVAMFSNEMWVPLAGMSWSIVFGLPFLFF